MQVRKLLEEAEGCVKGCPYTRHHLALYATCLGALLNDAGDYAGAVAAYSQAYSCGSAYAVEGGVPATLAPAAGGGGGGGGSSTASCSSQGPTGWSADPQLVLTALQVALAHTGAAAGRRPASGSGRGGSAPRAAAAGMRAAKEWVEKAEKHWAVLVGDERLFRELYGEVLALIGA